MKANVVLFWAAVHVSIALAQSPGTFTPAGNMSTPRGGHTAILLANGKVLIAGGAGGGSILSNAELYDPLTATFTATGSMITPRYVHTATLLLDGRVLIAGGYFRTRTSLPTATASAELYDPSTGTFTATSGMTTSRVGHTATLLLNGKVLIAGAGPGELYDPVTSAFTATGAYAGRFAPFSPYVNTATLLPDGKVLITASTDLANLATTELYDPVGGTFSLLNPIFTTWALVAPRQPCS